MTSLSDKAKSVIRTVAPSLGRALGGPLGELAARTVAGAVTGDEAAPEEALEQAIIGATPDQLLALKKADAEFKKEMKSLDIRLEEITAEDRASARDRQIRSGDRAPAILGTIVVVGFFAILGALLFLDIPQTGETILKIMTGALGGMTMQVMNFYFGSSSGSKVKTAILEGRLRPEGGRG